MKSSISWSKATSATITILDYTYGKLLLWFNHVSNLQSVLLYIPDWKHASMESFMSKHPLGCIEKLATASVTSHLDFESLVLEMANGYLKPRAISQMYTCGPSLVFHWTGWGGSTWGATCEGTCYSQYWSKRKLVLILHKMSHNYKVNSLSSCLRLSAIVNSSSLNLSVACGPSSLDRVTLRSPGLDPKRSSAPTSCTETDTSPLLQDALRKIEIYSASLTWPQLFIVPCKKWCMQELSVVSPEF